MIERMSGWPPANRSLTITRPVAIPMRTFSGVTRRRFQRTDGAGDFERRTDRALGIVLGRDRIAEIRQDPIADEPGDMAAEAVDRGTGKLPVAFE